MDSRALNFWRELLEHENNTATRTKRAPHQMVTRRIVGSAALGGSILNKAGLPAIGLRPRNRSIPQRSPSFKGSFNSTRPVTVEPGRTRRAIEQSQLSGASRSISLTGSIYNPTVSSLAHRTDVPSVGGHATISSTSMPPSPVSHIPAEIGPGSGIPSVSSRSLTFSSSAPLTTSQAAYGHPAIARARARQLQLL
jgi:hypothetical protein